MQFATSRKKFQGFTLIEILVVIGIIAILAAAVIIAINPARQFSQANNSRRWSNINAILNAVHQNIVDNRGTFTCAAGALPVTSTVMASTGGYDICGCLSPTYIAAMPYDPSSGSFVSCGSYNSGYYIMSSTTASRITVSAPSAELSESISVTR